MIDKRSAQEYFDERHYVTPRGDRSPGMLHVEPPRAGALYWAVVALALAICAALLWATDCGATWCW